jgi:hypothetical protein
MIVGGGRHCPGAYDVSRKGEKASWCIVSTAKLLTGKERRGRPRVGAMVFLFFIMIP